jgi:uncharacterized membrane protein YbjE (DUF340 family)
MFVIIGIMFGGVAIGYLLRKFAIVKKSAVGIPYTIYLLLFFLGISVGTNRSIMENLSKLGFEAFLIAFAGTFGSVLAAWGVYHFFFKKRESNG